MPTHRLLGLAGLTRGDLLRLRRSLPAPLRRRGRPSSFPPRRRLLVACAALRTNLIVRELAAVVGLSKSTVHRIVASLTPMLPDLARPPTRPDRRETWIVDGTLIPTRDHASAAKSKNYRWSWCPTSASRSSTGTGSSGTVPGAVTAAVALGSSTPSPEGLADLP